MSRGVEQALIVLGLIVLGIAVGAGTAALGVERPWTYVILGAVVLVVVPLLLRWRSRSRR